MSAVAFIAGYLAVMLLTAITYARANQGAAPTGPDPVGTGLVIGLLWPFTLTVMLLACLVRLAEGGEGR